MATDNDEGAVWLHAQRRVTLVELSEACGLPVASIEELVEYGALGPVDESGLYAARCVATVRDATRLCADLELDMPAVALVVRFLERIHALEDQVRHLDAQVHRPR